MESEILKAILQSGGMGVIAALIFFFYRQDRQLSESKQTQLGQDFRQTVESNTAAMTKLIVLVEQLTRHQREQDDSQSDPHPTPTPPAMPLAKRRAGV